MFFTFLSLCFCDFYLINPLGYIETRSPEAISFQSIPNFEPFVLLVMDDFQFQNFSESNITTVEMDGHYPVSMNYTQIFNITELKEEIPFTIRGRSYFVGIFYPNNSSFTDAYILINESWGWLPLSQFITMIISWLEMCLYLTILTITVVNRASHPNISTKLNVAAMSAVFMQFLFSVVFSLILTISNTSPNIDATIIILVFFGLRNFVVAVLSLLLVFGLSLVSDTLPALDYVIIFTSSLLLAFIQCLLIATSYMELPLYQNILIIIFFIAVYSYFVFAFIHGAVLSLKRLNAHLILCAQKGINPATVPTFKKIRYLMKFRNLSFAIFILIMIAAIFFMVSAIPMWIPYLILAIATGVIFCFCVYYSWLRNSLTVEYGDDDDDMYRVNDDENPDPEFPYNDEQRLQMLRQWQIDEKLPPIPESFKLGTRIADE